MSAPESGRIAWIADGLVQAGEKVPQSLAQRILDAGETAVPTLLSILTDEHLQRSNGPANGWAPISAATLLGELRASVAIEPLLDVLSGGDGFDILGDRATSALQKMGALAVEPVLARHAAAESDDLRQRFMSVLGGLGVRDERIFALLVEELGDDPIAAAMELAEYGDPRALPHLSRAFDALEIEESDHPFANQESIELRAAIDELGGALTLQQQEKMLRVEAARRQWSAKLKSGLSGSAVSVAPKKPGRNDPCPCGSGKKYKKCCLQKDEAAGR